MRTKILIAWFCSLITALAAAALATPAPASATAQSGPVVPACAWYEFSVTVLNQGAQDSAAAYWLLPFTVQDGLQITLGGRYPDSRYASLQVYKSAGGLFTVNGVASALTDYEIQPDPGSVNPWQVPWRHPRRGGDAFTVTLQSDVAPGRANTLPLAPTGTAPGTAGYLFYRVYLPAHGDFSRVPLPVVTFTLGGVSQQVPPCPAGAASPVRVTASGAPAAAAASGSAPHGASQSYGASAATQTVAFARRPTNTAGFPNADSGYLTAVVTPPGNGDVLVIRGRAPTASPGDNPSPWPVPFIDLRYWSLCDYLVTPTEPLVANPLPDGQVDYGCRYDSQVALDRDGYYTFVVGTEAQRAVIDRIPGATFLPFSAAAATTPHALLLRDMLANPGFAEAVQSVPQDGSPASAAAVMGPYYPSAVICPLATLVGGGPGACQTGTDAIVTPASVTRAPR